MKVLYKPLLEVRLTHEYFITDVNGHTLFGETDQPKRMQFLLDAYSNDVDSIEKELLISFSDTFKSLHDACLLKLIPAYSGFKIMVKVNQSQLDDKTIVYTPVTDLPDDLCACISIAKKTNLIDQLTNSRISTPFPSNYFFTNENIVGDKVWPFITNPIPPLDPLFPYEQGEMATYGTSIRSFYTDNNGAEQWNPVTGTSFANESDRMLVPLQFTYTIPTTANVTTATFALKDSKGNEIRTITAANGTSPLNPVPLDFSANVPHPLALGITGSLIDYTYQLQVTGDNGYRFARTLLFSKELYNPGTWAVIMIQTKAKNTQFNLLDSDGRLFTRRQPDNTLINAPTFEMPIGSRFGYFRYFNDRGKQLTLAPDLTAYLYANPNNPFLQTLKPRTISKLYLLLTDNTGTQTKYLPNPVNYTTVKDKGNRICFDIRVPQSDLFPIVL
ncbi:MAG: hypothetical protein BGO55_03530 [Sphingobacteriales bacterium 50-39]|nr:hypothetical protein [Sphingobacteriales bacterium]OJW55620.1 MAG: hypothetical protein BGO55_03530 [Sphingobacteriales bacterium 50-39]